MNKFPWFVIISTALFIAFLFTPLGWDLIPLWANFLLLWYAKATNTEYNFSAGYKTMLVFFGSTAIVYTILLIIATLLL